MSIRNHNRLLGNVEGVDGIKTGYTRASGFNLVTSMRRGNRHLVGVVLGGRSGGSRDAIMRNLLAENLEKGATRRTVAAITERSAVRRPMPTSRKPKPSHADATVQAQGAVQVASGTPGRPPRRQRVAAPAKPSVLAAAAAAVPPGKPSAEAEPRR